GDVEGEARNSAERGMRNGSKNRRSSVASVALIKWSGNWSSGIASLWRMAREPTSLPERSRQGTASSDFFSQSSSEGSRKAGGSRASRPSRPPPPHGRPSARGSTHHQRPHPATD